MFQIRVRNALGWLKMFKDVPDIVRQRAKIVHGDVSWMLREFQRLVRHVLWILQEAETICVSYQTKQQIFTYRKMFCWYWKS